MNNRYFKATILAAALALVALAWPGDGLGAAKGAAAASAKAGAKPAAPVLDVPALQALLGKEPEDGPVAAAEALCRAAESGGLTPGHLALAAQLLKHDDPFVRGLVEWAIAIKVQSDNVGERIVWPSADSPEWFAAWSALPAASLLDEDYVRQAWAAGILHDAAALVASADAILRRAESVAGEIAAAGPPPEKAALVSRQLAALASIRKQMAEQAGAGPAGLPPLRRLWLEARRAARPVVLAGPEVDFGGLVVVTGHSGHGLANITGSQYPWTHKPGGDIVVKTGLDPDAKARPVLAGQLGPGHVHGIDLWWDADRVVFGYARQPAWPPKYNTVEGNCSFELRTDQPPTHLFEVRLDGSGLRQMTDHPVWSDFEPTYCPSGDVAFASDRSGRSSECGKFSSDHTVINLYACGPDGAGIRRLNDNKDIDRYPHALDDGRIGYTRWDYQERHFFEIHSIWAVRPDGTMADAIFKQHLKAPFGLRDVRSVPGGPKLVAIATGHHTLAYGPVMLIDPTQGINQAAAMRVVTPGVVPQEGPAAGLPPPEGGVRDAGGVYQTPWALSEKRFLVSYSYGRMHPAGEDRKKAQGFAVYLIDVHGNKELLHRDRVLSAWSPMPVRQRPRPPVLPDSTDRSKPWAVAYVANVYEGLDGVSRGAVKSIRILQRVGWPLDEKIGGQRWIPGNAFAKQFGFWSWAPVRVIGTAPVEVDGSAHFKVPADTAVYFQALDERGMELRRMRTHVTFQPGEVRGCLGCHETTARPPAAYATETAAMGRPPDTPAPPPWGATRLLGYEWLIQPILDRHCVRCHGKDDPAGLNLTAARAPDGFYQSFRTLFGVPGAAGGKPGRMLVAVSDRFSGAEVTQPMQFGSHRSPLVLVLIGDDLHKKEVKLSDAEWTALVTWVDANAPYYDTFFNKRPADGGPPRREVRIECPEPFPVAAPQATVTSLQR